MPPATPPSILSSADRRSWRASGWSVTVADPASAVVAFMLQGCRRRWPPSIGISPGSTLKCTPKASGSSLIGSGCNSSALRTCNGPRWILTEFVWKVYELFEKSSLALPGAACRRGTGVGSDETSDLQATRPLDCRWCLGHDAGLAGFQRPGGTAGRDGRGQPGH